MTREELEHIIRASGDITNQYEFVVVGSQSMLGSVPNPEEVFTVSMEVDIYPLQAPELADKIDGAIGEGSQFHQSFGYYAQGVARRLRYCQRTGCNGCTEYKATTPMVAWGTVWTCSTSSFPKPRPDAQKTVNSAWRC
jgi:hypothetical protein